MKPHHWAAACCCFRRGYSLKPGVGYLPTTLDIIDNPKQLKIVKWIPAADPYPDDPNVSLSIINTNFSAQAGLSAARDGLFMEGPDSPYVNAMVAREDNKDKQENSGIKSRLPDQRSRGKSEGSLQRRRDQRLVSLNRRRPCRPAPRYPRPANAAATR